MTELCDLGYTYGTDKCPKIKHQYTPVYYEMFKDKRNDFKKVLELGVYFGASLRMWRDFFPNAHIFGIDNKPEYMFKGDRITTFLADATDKVSMEKVIGEIGQDIDLVIDDGSHRLQDILSALNILMPLLKQDVIYIIEDSRHTQWFEENLKIYKPKIFVFQRRFGSLAILKKP